MEGYFDDSLKLGISLIFTSKHGIISLKQHSPTPTLANMIAFVQRIARFKVRGYKDCCDVAESSLSTRIRRL